MRILALSDVYSWDGCEELVAEYRPQVVALAGDLTSDGSAAFWKDGFEAIPAYREEKQAALNLLGIKVEYDGDMDMDVISGGSLKDVMNVEFTLKQRYRDTRAFAEARHRLHTNKFYAFLKFAGREASVLVVKGDHDDDCPGDYRPRRINRIGGCREISGEAVTVGGLTFLGLGYDQSGFRKPLRDFVRLFQGAIDVVIAHPPHRNVPIVAELKPRLLIRGHYASGQYLINGVPSVFTAGSHALIELTDRDMPEILVPSRYSDPYLLEKYDWLSPYPAAALPFGKS